QLRQRLSRIESRVTMRDRVKEDIVRQRVEELLHPERSWEPGDGAGASASAVDPTAGAVKRDIPRVVQNYQTEPAESAKDESGRPALSSSDSARSAQYGAAVFPADGKNPREAVLNADFALVAARAAVAAAEKGRDFSKSDLQRTQALYEKGAVADKALR